MSRPLSPWNQEFNALLAKVCPTCQGRGFVYSKHGYVAGFAVLEEAECPCEGSGFATKPKGIES